MKKIIILIALNIYGLSAMAQQITLKNSVTFNIPKGAEQITQQQAIAHARTKYNDSLVVGDYKGQRSDYMFKINDIVISVRVSNHSGSLNLKESYLSFKKGLDALVAYSGTPPYPSNIKRINADTVITNYMRFGKAEYCYFYYFHGSSHAARRVYGELEFDPADAAKAKAILDDLLNSIKFVE